MQLLLSSARQLDCETARYVAAAHVAPIKHRLQRGGTHISHTFISKLHAVPWLLPPNCSLTDPVITMHTLEKEQQWLELADYLIKHFALRRRLLADSMPA
jgi:hypothetical protein